MRLRVPFRAVTHRLAAVACGATFLLILVGGLVTNTGAALAVPDWPTTFGYNMLLYPWSRMVGGVLYEHSHRLLGAAVGLITLALAGALWPAGGVRRSLGLVALGAVCLQGLLGGLRVVLLKDALAVVHGSLAQAFFALLVVIAFLTWPGAVAAGRGLDASLGPVAAGMTALLYAQIVLGALLTHAGWVELHVAGAVAVYAVVPLAAARLGRTADPVATPAARMLLILLLMQLALGVGSYLTRFAVLGAGAHPALVVALPVAHRLLGALILGASVVVTLRVWGVARVGAAVPRRLAAEATH